MALIDVRGARLFHELSGSGDEKLVLVHGSWVDHTQWDGVVDPLGERFRVVTYDRRGHGASVESGPGTASDDVADLVALIERVGSPPVHLAGNSFGGSIALKCAAERPELLRSLAVHEPPLLGLLAGKPEHAELFGTVRALTARVLAVLANEGPEPAAREFVDTVALGPGAWNAMPQETRDVFVRNAHTWADEMQDPDGFVVDLPRLGTLQIPVLLTEGGQSPPLFRPILDMLQAAMPNARRHLFESAGHIPHVTHPAELAAAVEELASLAA
jgi:pimeloyl-ACP methyl ester carboxylesterase